MVGDILQPTHLLFILVVALLVLGPKRLPEVGKSLGRGLRDFRQAISGEDDEPSSDFMGQPIEDVTSPASAPEATSPASTAPAPPAPATAAAAESTSATATEPTDTVTPVS